jgi:hypothetical protein
VSRQALGTLILAVGLYRMHAHGFSNSQAGLALVQAFVVLACVHVAILVAVVRSPALWPLWREPCLGALRAVEAVLVVFVMRHYMLLTLEKGRTDRWNAWLVHCIVFGGYYVSYIALSHAYRLRFSTGFPLLAAHLGLCLGTMDWSFLDTIRQFYPDVLSTHYWWLLGASGESALRMLYCTRLILVGFLGSCYFSFKTEWRSRTAFAEGRGYELDISCDPLYFLLLLFVVVSGLLIAEGYPTGLVLSLWL